MNGAVLLLWAVVSFAGFFVHGEEMNCTVKGMHCDACVTMVKEKICNDTFAVCDVTMKNKKGLIHIKTKDVAGKINETEMSKAIADTTYSIDVCTPVKGKG